MCETTNGSGTDRRERTTEELEAIFTDALKTMKAAEPPMVRLDQHGRFIDLAEAVRLLQLGAEAMIGIGTMMEPYQFSADESLTIAKRSEATAVFRFFGEALKEPALRAADAMDALSSKGWYLQKQ